MWADGAPKFIIDDTIPTDTLVGVDWSGIDTVTATGLAIEQANKRAKHMAVYNGRGMGKTLTLQQQLDEMLGKF